MNGIAAINTINSITGVDIDTLVAEPSVRGKSIIGGYSGAAVKPIALRFISDLFRCEELAGMHISGMGGIETWIDALEFILLVAGSVQVTTAVMQYGHRIIEDLIEGLSEYMKGKGSASFRDLVGGAAETVVDHSSIERDTIHFDPETRKPKLNGKKCVGCHLCRLVCPEMAIRPATNYWMPEPKTLNILK